MIRINPDMDVVFIEIPFDVKRNLGKGYERQSLCNMSCYI